MEDGTYRCIVNPAQSVSLSGNYDGMKEFTIITNGIAGSYKTYRVDGATITEKQASLQMGDYFCKDSDNKWYIIPQEAAPDGNVIGIVFYAGHNGGDMGDYSKSGIGQQKCHGYVVALTDANNGESDRLRWEYGPNNEYSVFIKTSPFSWNGYSDSLKFHEFLSNNTSWEMKHFPAAFACETYGNRTLDHEGNQTDDYDWQHPLAAPALTSGWFLPSYSQLKHLYENGSLLSARMADVKNSTPDDCSYNDYIKWFKSSNYWSSTESNYRSRYLDFVDGISHIEDKNIPFNVRAVLAF